MLPIHIYSYVWGHALEHGQPTMLKTWLSFTQKASTVCNSADRDGAYEPLSASHTGMLTGLVLLRSCAGNGSSCEFMNGGILLCPAGTVSCSRPPQRLGFCNHSTPIPSVMALSLGGKKIKMSQLWLKTPLTLILCILIRCQFLC